MKSNNRMLKVSMLAAALLLAQVAYGFAQDIFPSRPIRIVVPFPAGGVLDIMARLVATKVAESSRNPVVVENRAGGSGHLAAATVKTAPADGYTLLLATNSHLTDPVFLKPGAPKLPYDYLDDLTGVASLVRVANVLAVHKDFPAKTVQELVAAVKKQPGKYNFGSNGRGQPGHLIGLQLKYATGIDLSMPLSQHAGSLHGPVDGDRSDRRWIAGFAPAVPGQRQCPGNRHLRRAARSGHARCADICGSGLPDHRGRSVDGARRT